jgi:hypothetical protein
MVWCGQYSFFVWDMSIRYAGHHTWCPLKGFRKATPVLLSACVPAIRSKASPSLHPPLPRYGFSTAIRFRLNGCARLAKF